MANPLTFGNAWINAIQTLVSDINFIRLMQDRAGLDAGLAQAYLTASGRTDIAVADLQAAYAAINQLLATLDAGNPVLKAAIYKVLP
jgi:hypothetical protein